MPNTQYPTEQEKETMSKARQYDLQDRLIDFTPESKLTPLIEETDELIAILFTSIETAKKGKEP
jgi:hypothetical protein